MEAPLVVVGQVFYRNEQEKRARTTATWKTNESEPHNSYKKGETVDASAITRDLLLIIIENLRKKVGVTI